MSWYCPDKDVDAAVLMALNPADTKRTAENSEGIGSLAAVQFGSTIDGDVVVENTAAVVGAEAAVTPAAYGDVLLPKVWFTSWGSKPDKEESALPKKSPVTPLLATVRVVRRRTLNVLEGDPLLSGIRTPTTSDGLANVE
jgi:hypothetical protein